VAHPAEADERLEVLGDELRPVVRDDPQSHTWESFAGPLHDLLDVHLGHYRADLSAVDVTAPAIKDVAHVVECVGDVEVGAIHVPVLVRL
jgi:hypothetical protein